MRRLFPLFHLLYASSILWCHTAIAQNDTTFEYNFSKALQFQHTNADSSIVYANRALKTVIPGQPQTGQCYNLMGRLLVGFSRYDTAKFFHQKALEIARQSGDRSEEAESFNNMGIVADEQSDHSQAIKYYLEALLIFDEMQDRNGIAKVNNNIGIVYKDIGQLQTSIPYYKKSVEAYKELSNQLGVASLLNNLATVHNQLSQYDSAHRYALESIEFFESEGYNHFSPYPKINAGDALIGLEKYKEALAFLVDAKEGLSTTGNNKELSDVYRSLSKAWYGTGNLVNSINAAHQSLKIAQKLNIQVYTQNSYQQLSTIYEAEGVSDSALYYFKLHSLVKDTIREESRVHQIDALKIQFESDKKNRELTLASVKIESQRNENLALVIGLILVLVVSILIYIWIQAKHRKRVSDIIITEQKQSLDQVIQAQEVERRKIARDLHDSVGQSMSLIQMKQKKMLNDVSQPDLKKDLSQIISMVTETQSEIRGISHEMMPSTLTEVGLPSAINQLLDTVENTTDIKINYECLVNEAIRYNDRIEIGLFRICQELIQNIVKHAGAAEITLNLYEKSNNLHLIVEDDGKGFDLAKVEKGIGLSNINTRLQLIRGTLNITSEAGSGTLSTIKIPL